MGSVVSCLIGSPVPSHVEEALPCVLGKLVLSNDLSLVVVAHVIRHFEDVYCHSYVTEGLSQYGQQEVAFTFRIKNQSQFEKSIVEHSIPLPHPSLPSFLLSCLDYAKRDVVVVNSSFSMLSLTEGSGLFGRNDFRGICYLECDNSALPRDALQAYVFTADEIAALSLTGSVRALSAAGNHDRFFPSPSWIDIDRPQRFGKNNVINSIITKLKLPMIGTNQPKWAWSYLVCKINKSGYKVDNRYNLPSYHTNISPVGDKFLLFRFESGFIKILEQIPQQVLESSPSFGLFTQHHPGAQIVMVYSVNEPGTLRTISGPMHQHNQQDETFILGNFVFFVECNVEGKLGAQLVEDGFVIFVPQLRQLVDEFKRMCREEFDESESVSQSDRLYRNNHGELIIHAKKDDENLLSIMVQKVHSNYSNLSHTPRLEDLNVGSNYKPTPPVSLFSLELQDPDSLYEQRLGQNYSDKIVNLTKEVLTVVEKCATPFISDSEDDIGDYAPHREGFDNLLKVSNDNNFQVVVFVAVDKDKVECEVGYALVAKILKNQSSPEALAVNFLMEKLKKGFVDFKSDVATSDGKLSFQLIFGIKKPQDPKTPNN
jgi:hypothetical protein